MTHDVTRVKHCHSPKCQAGDDGQQPGANGRDKVQDADGLNEQPEDQEELVQL